MYRLLLVLFFLLFYYESSAKFEDKFVDSLIVEYLKGTNEQQLKIPKIISSYISKKDTFEVFQLYKSFIKYVSPLNERLLSQAHYYYARQLLSFRYHNGFLRNYYKGIIIAQNENLRFEIGDFYSLKAEYFKRTKKYDSLFVYTLKAESYFDPISDIDKIVTINYLLADAYFSIELFDNAERYYQKIMTLKGDSVYWNKYRKYLTLNNIGLCKFNQDSLYKALNYFRKAYDIQNALIKNDTNNVFLLRIAYSNLCFASVYNKTKDFEKAYHNFLKAKAILEELGRLTEFNDFYTVGASIYMNLNKLDSSGLFLRKAISIQNSKKDLKNLIKSYQLLSEYYFSKFNFDKSLEYFHLANEINEKRRIELDISKILQIKAEHEFDIYNSKIENAESRFIFTLIALIVAIVLLFFIAFLYYKIRKANKLLVKKTVEIVQTELSIVEKTKEISIEHDSIDTDNSIFTSADVENVNDSNIKDLANRIESIILKEKLFLRQEFSVNDLSEILKVNRTYISKAVNSYLSTENFKTYLNTLRIKEALKLLNNDANDIYTLEAIYEKSGFSSRNSFNRAFLKHTGVTPSYYQKNRHEFETSN